MPGTEEDGGGIHGMFIFRYDFASVITGLIKALGVEMRHDLSIEIAGSLDVGPLDFNKLVEDPYAVLDVSLMVGATIKPGLFNFFIWMMGKVLTVPIMIILEIIFLLIEAVRVILIAAEVALGIAQVAWDIALIALAAIGITEAYAAQRALQKAQEIRNLEAELAQQCRIASELCVPYIYTTWYEVCVWGICTWWPELHFTSRNRYGEIGCNLFRQAAAALRVIWLGIQIAAAWIEMKIFEVFLEVADLLAKAKAWVRKQREDMDRELLKLNLFA